MPWKHMYDIFEHHQINR